MRPKAVYAAIISHAKDALIEVKNYKEALVELKNYKDKLV